MTWATKKLTIKGKNNNNRSTIKISNEMALECGDFGENGGNDD